MKGNDVTKVFNKKVINKAFKKLCIDSATLDQECFIIGTDPKDKTFADVSSIIDTDKNGKLSKREIQKFYKAMDIDNDRIVSRLEMEVWYKRNEYIICRPWR